MAGWHFVDIGAAVHCFTETEVHSPGNCMYNTQTSERGNRMLRGLLDESVAKK